MIKNRPLRKTRKPKKRKEGRQDCFITPDWRDEDPFGDDAEPDTGTPTMGALALWLLSGMEQDRRTRGKRRYRPIMRFSSQVELRLMGGHSGLAMVSTPWNKNRKGRRKR